MSGRKSPVSALITAEHAVCDVPDPWAALFAGAGEVLESHRGWDPGSLALARRLAGRLGAPLLAGRASRLLIDLNRSPGHPGRLSEWTRSLPAEQRRQIEQAWWLPHWQAYRRHIENSPPPVLHIACHSFTPVLAGRTRNADIGLLYDPSRQAEKQFCRQLKGALNDRLPGLKVRMNDPYRGTSNGIGQHHRRLYGEDRLITIEFEVNQRLVGVSGWDETVDGLCGAVEVVACGDWWFVGSLAR